MGGGCLILAARHSPYVRIPLAPQTQQRISSLLIRTAAGLSARVRCRQVAFVCECGMSQRRACALMSISA